MPSPVAPTWLVVGRSAVRRGHLLGAHLDVGGETARGQDDGLLGLDRLVAGLGLDADADDLALELALAVDLHHLGVDEGLDARFLAHLLLDLDDVAALAVDGGVGAVAVVPARPGQALANLEAVGEKHVEVEGRSVDHVLHELDVAHVVATLHGVGDVGLGGVRDQVELLLEVGRELAGVGRVHAAVDLGVAAHEGHFLDQDGLGAVGGRAVRGREAREAAADDDDVVLVIPLGGQGLGLGRLGGS